LWRPESASAIKARYMIWRMGEFWEAKSSSRPRSIALGETEKSVGGSKQPCYSAFDANRLIRAVEEVCGIPRADFCSTRRNSAAVSARELLILTGCELGASQKILAEITGLDSSTVSRRYDAAQVKVHERTELESMAKQIKTKYDSHD